jgi:hypothetical protein
VHHHWEIKKPSFTVQRKGSRIVGLPHAAVLAICGEGGRRKVPDLVDRRQKYRLLRWGSVAEEMPCFLKYKMQALSPILKLQCSRCTIEAQKPAFTKKWLSELGCLPKKEQVEVARGHVAPIPTFGSLKSKGWK